jgi:hypothetical protein
MKDKYRKEVDGEWYLHELQKDGKGLKWIKIHSTFGNKKNISSHGDNGNDRLDR